MSDSKYTESELYSIFASVGYELASGSTPEEVEQDIIDDYGIKIELDKELTDNYGAIIKFGDEIIHSIRGTNLNPIDWDDIATDFQLMGLNPHIGQIALLGGGVAGLAYQAEAIYNQLRQDLVSKQLPDVPAPIKQLILDSLDKIKNTLGLKPPPPLTPPTPPFMSLGFGQINPAYLEWEAKYGHLVEHLQPSMSPELLAEEYREAGQLARSAGLYANKVWWRLFISFGLYAAVIGGLSLINNVALTRTYGDRKSREEKRFKRARDKYKGKKFSFTGHSLGSVANDLGRTYNIKSITFNPAPIYNNSKKPHVDSKIYRINHDFVSAFLTENDTEPITTTNKYPWYTNFDFLTEQAVDYITPKSLEPIKPFLKDYLSPGKLGFLKIHEIDNFLPTKKKTKNDKPTTVVKQSQRHLLLTHKHKNENYDQLLKRYSHRPIVKLLHVYSGIFEDSIEEFLPNYQRQDLSYTNKLKFKHKLKKKIYI